MDNIIDAIVGQSMSYFQNTPVTPETLKDFIGRIGAFYPEYQLDEKRLFNILESIHSVRIDTDLSILEDAVDHIDWFNPDTNLPLERDFDWHFWKHYRDYLLFGKNWPHNVVNSLDRFSSQVLCRIEDPLRAGPWDRRGMVVGSVQSGKTANYTALITKAADAGFKLFIILAGVHNSLRSQTQYRINEEFLGYDLDVVQKTTGEEKRIGVRLMFQHHNVVNTLTSSADKGDFKAAVANNAGIIPSITGDPIILIVKKNVSILSNLIQWATTLGVADSKGARIVKEVPMLLIDDESDFASVNTKKPERDEDGNIIEEWDPTKTNIKIRQLLSAFDKSVYVGYTATPYANIFIHKEDPHPKYGEDLFPEHFLISLPQPSNYIGPEEVFGIKGDPDAGIDPVEPLPLLVEVDDHEPVIPSKHKKDLDVHGLPPSLIEALKYFILTCAARRLRSIGVPHSTMLVHVTRFTMVQGKVKQLIEDEIRSLTGRIMNSTEKLSDFAQIWEQTFIPVTLEMKKRGFSDSEIHEWRDIRAELYGAIKNMRIRGINGEIGDTLDYREAEKRNIERKTDDEKIPWAERGVNLIAIGGDKLSRGLTLEGLSISYYLRSAKMYDTLMQMGRWFGYRDGYNDLCRIFTTSELIEWYRFIALANRELRNDFDYMAAIGSTPEKFGLKVRNHPGRLAITSAGKSRATEPMQISFSGKFPITVVFDPRESRNNLKALETLIKDIGKEPDEDVKPAKPRFHWKNVNHGLITKFLRSYKTQEIAKRVVDPERIAEFIEKQVSKDELTNWHVVLVSNTRAKTFHSLEISGYEVACVLRKPILDIEKDKISIGTLISPADEALDLTVQELKDAREFDRKYKNRELGENEVPGSVTIRNHRPKERALLLIYLPACDDDDKGRYGLEGEEVVGFAISFPESDTAEPIEYLVNAVYMEEVA